MKRLRQTCKILYLTAILLFSGLMVKAAVRYSVATGNWNSTAIWSATSGGPSGSSFPVAGDVVYIENGHTVTVTADAACASITFTGVSATLIVNSSVALSLSGTITLNISGTNNTACTISGAGSMNCANINVGTSPFIPVSTFNHTITSTINALTISGNLTIYSFKNGGIRENGDFYLSAGTLSIAGSIATVDDNGSKSTFSMATGGQNGTLILSGVTPFNVSGPDIILLNGTSALVNYNRVGNQTVYATPYTNLILSGSGLKTTTGITVNAVLSMEGTSTASAAPTYGAAATLQYNGSSAQTTGLEFVSPFIATGGVIIDNLNGVTIGSSRTINTLITLQNGVLTTGVNILTLSSSAVVSGAGVDTYINGNLQKGIAIGTVSKTFEIGDASAYTPVLLEFAGTISVAGNITARTTSGDHPNLSSSTISPDESVNRYWTLTNSGVSGFTSYSATLNFVTGDIDAMADFNYFIIGIYNASTWSYPSVGTKNPTSIQSTGMSATDFGDFQIGISLQNSFRSIASGNWDQTGTWEIYTAGAWGATLVTPTSASGIITIRSANTVTNTSSVTVDQVKVDSGGTLVINSDMTVADGLGTDITVNGTIDFGAAVSLTGPGSFVLAGDANIIIRSPDGISSSGATGNIQTIIRSFDAEANYTYGGTTAQVTGTGLPATVNNLTINNTTGVTLTNSVNANGILTLTSGAFSIGANSLTFQNSSTPIVKTSGTITTSSDSNISFGSPGNTGGATFTIPSGTFTSAPIINNLTINRINSLILNDQVMSLRGIMLCNGPLTTNGNLTLLSTATQTALIDGNSTGQITGNVTLQRYLSSGFGYKYFSSPFQAATVNEFADDMTLGSFTFFRYDESRTASGWVNYHTPTTNPLIPLQGYAVNFGSGSAPNTVDVTGAVNNGSLSVTLYNNNNLFTDGFNLIGNPYPSPIDWISAAGWTKTNIDDALYFFKASASDQYGGTYIYYVNGFSTGGTTLNIVPSMQGFFVHVTDGPPWPVSGTLGMDNNVRVTDQTQPFTKSGTKSSISFLRLSAAFSDDTTSFDPVVIYSDEKATPEFDSKLDALKLMNTDLKVPNLYAITPVGAKLSISATPEILSTPDSVPLGLKINKDGDIIFRIHDIDETLSAMRISLYDKMAGIEQNLLPDKEYKLYLTAGEYTNRFFLNLKDISTDLPDLTSNTGSFTIYCSQGILKAEINSLQGGKGTLTIINLTGQTIITEKIYATGYYEFNPDVKEGIYIVSFITGNKRISKKIFIQNK